LTSAGDLGRPCAIAAPQWTAADRGRFNSYAGATTVPGLLGAPRLLRAVGEGAQ
jgi:hypothetical protein